MPIRVDLPAPFSPTMPWIVPGRTTRETSRLAWTSPNHLSMPRSSMAAGGAPSASADGRDVRGRSAALIGPSAPCSLRPGWLRASRPGGSVRATGSPPPRRLFHRVVRDLDLAGHDVGARLLQPLLHLRGDQA